MFTLAVLALGRGRRGACLIDIGRRSRDGAIGPGARRAKAAGRCPRRGDRNILTIITSFAAFDELFTGSGLAADVVADRLIAMAERSICRDED
jgi:hypothetical protein